MKQHLRLLCGIVIITLLAACALPPVSITPTLTIVLSASPTATATVRPTSTTTPTALPPTSTPTTIPTPSATLTDQQETKFVVYMLKSNGGCKLPCWWGFTPGLTTWPTAVNFFASIGKKPAAYHNPTMTNYTINFIAPTQATQIYIVKDDRISMIWAATDDSPHYILSQFLRAHGQPTEVWIRTYSNAREDELSFFIDLFYPEQGIMAMYVVPAMRTGDKIVACPQLKSPTLWLWSPDQQLTIEDIAVLNVGGPLSESDVQSYRSLQEATGIGIESFYHNFSKLDNHNCLETPAKLWP